MEPALPIPVPIEALCEQLDIISIGDLHTEGFEAALVTDADKSTGGILIAKGRSPRRRRFSIGHELGHFLIPTHRPLDGELLLCSSEHLRMLDTKTQDRRRRMEAEANRFAALLLMPPPLLREELRRIRRPEIGDIVRLADMFAVSKEALARSFVEYSREAVAVVVIRHGKVLRYYRNERNFPWIVVSFGQAVPDGSLYNGGGRPSPGSASVTEECDSEIWFDERAARNVAALSEQVLEQRDGYALLLLHAELHDDTI